jgi:hypothetical protein
MSDDSIDIIASLPITSIFAENEYLSPSQQWKNGLEPIEFDCRDNRFLMINPENGKPVCLFPSKSMIYFVEKGWLPTRDIVLDNPQETYVSGQGGEFSKDYFSFFEIKNENAIILHDKTDKKNTKTMQVGERLISNCQDLDGSSEITVFHLDNIDLQQNSAQFTQDIQTWPGGFCDQEKNILENYYSSFFIN